MKITVTRRLIMVGSKGRFCRVIVSVASSFLSRLPLLAALRAAVSGLSLSSQCSFTIAAETLRQYTSTLTELTMIVTNVEETT